MINQRGFTLIEIISVLLVMGVLVSVGAHFLLGGTSLKAEESVLTSIVISLNEKELESWTNLKLETGWNSDEEVYNNLKISDYKWNGHSQDGGIIIIRDKHFTLKRSRSARNLYGSWEVSNE